MTMATPAALTSDDIPPGSLSEDDLRQRWNQQSDQYNQWESLDSSEQLAWAQALAIRADRHAAALKAQPKGQRPTDKDLYDLAERFNGDTVPAMRRALELWGNPLQGAPAPGENLATALGEADIDHVEQLAAIIRRVDRNHSMGAVAIAKALLERYPYAFQVDPPATPPAPEVGEVAVPVAVSERPWERDGWLHPESGWCWYYHGASMVCLARWHKFKPSVHFQIKNQDGWLLPWHAIPLPQAGDVEA